jgi:hypothetical protein
MPVVVNELEIIVEPPEEASSETAAPAAPAPPLGAPEVNEIVDRRVRIASRTLAH